MAQTINTDVPAYMVDGTLTDGEAWVALQTVVIEGSSTGTVTMQSTTGANDWSQYQDLVMISYGRNGDGSASVMKMNLNNDTGSNYTKQQLYSNGAAITAFSGAESYIDFFWYPPSATAANVVACSVTTLFDINSGKHKGAQVQVANDMDGSGYVAIINCAWKNQSSITEIDLVDYSGDNIAAGSRFDLFGVLPRMVTA